MRVNQIFQCQKSAQIVLMNDSIDSSYILNLSLDRHLKVKIRL